MARTNPSNTLSGTPCQDESNANANKAMMTVTDRMRSHQTTQSGAAGLSNHYKLLGNFSTLLRHLSIIEVTFDQHVYRSVDELILVQRHPSRTEIESAPPSPVKQICATVADKAPVQYENNPTIGADPIFERKETEFNQSSDISLHSILDDNRDWPYLTDKCTCMLLRIPLRQRNKDEEYHSRYCPYNANMRKNTARSTPKAQLYLKSTVRFILMIASIAILFAFMAYTLIIVCHLSEQGKSANC